MGDAAEILGIKKEKKADGFESAIGSSSSSSSDAASKRKRTAKPPNVSREVYALLGRSAGGGDAGADAVGLPSMAPAPPRFKERHSGSGQV